MAKPPSERDELIAQLVLQLALTRIKTAPKQAIALLEAARQLAISDFEISIFRIQAFLRIGETKETLAETGRLLEKGGLSPVQRALVLRTHGSALGIAGQTQRGLEAGEAAHSASREAGDVIEEMYVVGLLGTLHSESGSFEKAEEYLRKALDFHTGMDNKQSMAQVMANLARLHSFRKDYTGAKDVALQAIALHREVGNSAGETLNLANYSGFCLSNGDFDEARACTAQALTLAEPLGMEHEILRSRTVQDCATILAVRASLAGLACFTIDDSARAQLSGALEGLLRALDIPQKYRTNAMYFETSACRAIGLFLVGRSAEAVAEAQNALAIVPPGEPDALNARLLADVRWIAGRK
ncbi:MAG: tetratricopeptide repeat protein [Planctomycetaceae bacterium]|nr:tetratricopeptide repeat protein [Planctomycetaceae bacterium]